MLHCKNKRFKDLILFLRNSQLKIASDQIAPDKNDRVPDRTRPKRPLIQTNVLSNTLLKKCAHQTRVRLQLPLIKLKSAQKI